MKGWENNSACILGYLELFKQLSADDVDQNRCVEAYQTLLARDMATPESTPLAPRILRERFHLDQRESLLLMAALAFEMDSGLRNQFRSRYGLTLPTIEYGLLLITPLCPVSVETIAELTGPNILCGLLLTTAEQTAYAMERPLMLCRAAVSFLTGLSLPDLKGVQAMIPQQDAVFLPIHEEALGRVQTWHQSGAANVLYLQGEAGSGRRTLLCRACGGAVCVEFERIEGLSALDRDHLFREAAILSTTLSIPICAVDPSNREILRELEWFHDRFSIPLTVLVEGDMIPFQADEVIRLTSQLSPQQREAAWRALVPRTAPHSIPDGCMTIGAVRATAELALRSAAESGHDMVQIDDTRRAQQLRGGALSFGIQYTPTASLTDMVLSTAVMGQLKQICMAAQCWPQLSAWGIPYQREGVTAVFHGPSGTGKTMAANAIARELGMPLLRADLSQIMDKYVGETEKHLGRLMQCARENRCVLLFDEADSLFGKRASVSTGHDKFANLSTSYLLQEIEQYEGVALLSTNLLSNFDDAFLRRLHYIVRFTLPDATLREQLWRRALPEDRLEGDIPFSALSQAELSPARINGIARSAAIAAMMDNKERIDTATIIGAMRTELEKNGKSLPRELASQLSVPTTIEAKVHVKML